MLSVNKINTNITYRSNKLYEKKLNSFGNNAEARQMYLDMNRDVFVDFVDGDISLAGFLARKLQNFFKILVNEDPTIETKARMIEKSIRRNPFQSY